MSVTIRWTTPLTRTGRRWLRCWLDRFTAGRPGLVERRPGAIAVRAGSPEEVRAFAALTMAVLGRPPYAYALAAPAESAATRVAA